MRLHGLARPATGLLLGLVAMGSVSSPALADTVSVALTVRGGAGAAAEGTVTVMAADGRAAPIEKPFRCAADKPCIVAVEVPEGGNWLASASSRGFWASPRTTAPGGTIGLWPSCTVRGALESAKGESVPSEVEVMFSGSPGPENRPGFTDQGTVTCPVLDGTFSCKLPAADLDLRLRAKGHISLYRWGVTLVPGGVTDLGRFMLRKGASIVGRVELAERALPPKRACTVRLGPATGPDRATETATGLPTSLVDSRGFFHLEVVPPGTWMVVAELDGFVSARRGVTVVEGMEASLKEPLVLALPARIELTLLPAQDPDGRPWVVEVGGKQGEGRYDSVANAPASLGGFWSRERMVSGHEYQVRVRTATGQAWWTDPVPFVLSGPVHRRTIEVGFEEVQGTVRLGDLPIPATVTFGAPKEMVAIGLRADSDGSFSGALPRLGSWHVAVASDQPSVRRNLEVEVRRGVDGRGSVEIVLEDGALVGEIVDESGKKLERAILTVSSMKTIEQSQEQVEGGTFRLTGFEPGRYLLSAEGRGVASEAVPAEISEDGASPFLRIVVRKKERVTLRVFSESGSPVGGAPVRVLRTTRYPGLEVLAERTDATGLVSFSAAPGVERQCFAVGLPGLSTLIADAAPGTEEQRVVIPSGGGTIVVEAPAAGPGEFTILWRGSCFAPLGLLASLVGRNGDSFPGLAPGDYRLCRHDVTSATAKPSCVDGFLSPRAVLTLQLGKTP